MRSGSKDKLMGQVNLVLVGREFIADGGSFTLTSGVLTHDPIRFGSSASMVNGAIEAFVRAAAIELPRGLRINAVSPGVLLESMPGYGPFFRGHEPVPAARVALAYAKSVEGARTGQVFEVLSLAQAVARTTWFSAGRIMVRTCPRASSRWLNTTTDAAGAAPAQRPTTAPNGATPIAA